MAGPVKKKAPPPTPYPSKIYISGDLFCIFSVGYLVWKVMIRLFATPKTTNLPSTTPSKVLNQVFVLNVDLTKIIVFLRESIKNKRLRTVPMAQGGSVMVMLALRNYLEAVEILDCDEVLIFGKIQKFINDHGDDFFTCDTKTTINSEAIIPLTERFLCHHYGHLGLGLLVRGLDSETISIQTAREMQPQDATFELVLWKPNIVELDVEQCAIPGHLKIPSHILVTFSVKRPDASYNYLDNLQGWH